MILTLRVLQKALQTKCIQSQLIFFSFHHEPRKACITRDRLHQLPELSEIICRHSSCIILQYVCTQSKYKSDTLQLFLLLVNYTSMLTFQIILLANIITKISPRSHHFLHSPLSPSDFRKIPW
jgi:hypothetical protein